ncbi:heterokaryon incompatibility protein-domain-containing protein [Massariosphaeria phaeospora]|uniref:Heterokaryon incompatibility protein-domain-containing protein n=1 Tax=Massariosphaeria phaeospora TaxID=100035 RepID=A0A7C8ICN8_9PLEO|nr:heterokaryon incompatibility protein-domain-containing protein [Massariosphaeria phaeospora]
MRLLHAETLEFHSFLESELPRYLILSHTWGNEEVSYQEMCLIINRKGYDKIVQTAKITRKRGFEYFWIDTCCIDKSSSAELQESINSMYRWYKISAYCVVHFEDAKPIEEQDHCLQNSRWNTRGWTLQELIAPPSLGFYDQTWKHIVEKRWALEQLSKVTQIPEYVLVTGDLTDTSVAQKMSWAAKRSTSRVEDMAYSLLGLFGIHMPMLYGEGENAFLRLQEEIMKTTTDDSIFAWDRPCAIYTTSQEVYLHKI